ncbi:hypothetical protein EDE15_3066 [Edaphobacter aggregans]|uniref:Uncharacterized protein n=1 Tax=Edaphobacter aggregans TaxID=570835 RepID=A0A3R9NYA8_9BACT|nr:hypothetical protein EDE15_3066 [Edaphobacter aggregans]
MEVAGVGEDFSRAARDLRHVMVGADGLLKPAKYAPHNVIAADAHKGEGFFRIGSDAVRESAPYHAMASMKPDFDIFFGKVQRLRCLGGAQLFDVAKHDDGTVSLGQL